MNKQLCVLACTLGSLAVAPTASAEDLLCSAPRSPALAQSGLLYERIAENRGQLYLEQWKESNGIAGLQTSGAACNGKPGYSADTFLGRFNVERLDG